MVKTRFSVVLDSAFRQRSEYPTNTKFVVPSNDVSTNEYVNTPIMIFAWFSLSRFITGTILGGSQSSLLISSAFANGVRNYYVGCLANLYNGAMVLLESSLITAYDPETNTITLQTPFTNSIRVNTNLRISYPDTVQNPYIVQALGYDPEYIFEYSTLYLYNFTKRWIRPIRFINKDGLINLVEPVPLSQYDVNDTFQIRNSLQILQFPLQSFFNSVVEFTVVRGTHDYQVGSYVYIEPDVAIPVGTRQVFQVRQRLDDGQVVLRVVEYGGPFGNQLYYPLYDPLNPTAPVSSLAEIEVIQLRTVIDAEDNPIPSPENNVLYLGAQLYEEFFYYSYVVNGTYIILIDSTNPYELLVDMQNLPLSDRQYGFLSKTTVQCALNVANFSIPDNQVCMQVKLEYLILPNQRVRGFNKLLSFFPYVVVKLYNGDSSQYSRFGTIVSNNRTTANCQFVCPIGNLLNPTIIKFVEVTSDMVQSLKITPYSDLYFEVLLPDGNQLEFEDTTVSFLQTLTGYSFSIRNTVASIFSFSLGGASPP